MNKKTELKEVLEKLMDAISKHENCFPYLIQLDYLKGESNMDPRLKHFLEKRSYEKALLYLKDKPSESRFL